MTNISVTRPPFTTNRWKSNKGVEALSDLVYFRTMFICFIFILYFFLSDYIPSPMGKFAINIDFSSNNSSFSSYTCS